MAIVTDTTLNALAAEIERRNELLRRFVDKYAATTWDAVQANVRAGRAAYFYDIGDELVCQYTLDGIAYDFPWVIVDIDRPVELQNGTTRPGLILQAKYATAEEIPFDAPEHVDATEPTAVSGVRYCGVNDNTYTMLSVAPGATLPYRNYTHIYKNSVNSADVFRYGYNRWSVSAVRQWLNSDAEAGEWWTSQHLGDSAPDEAETRAGFMRGLDDDFLSVIEPIKVMTAANTVTDGGTTDTTYDRFYLPSLEEIYAVPQKAGVEGSYFPYWKTFTGLSAPSNAANDGRKAPPVTTPKGTAAHLRGRSASRSTVYGSWCVHSSGAVADYGVSGSYRMQPVCAIC